MVCENSQRYPCTHPCEFNITMQAIAISVIVLILFLDNNGEHFLSSVMRVIICLGQETNSDVRGGDKIQDRQLFLEIQGYKGQDKSSDID